MPVYSIKKEGRKGREIDKREIFSMQLEQSRLETTSGLILLVFNICQDQICQDSSVFWNRAIVPEITHVVCRLPLLSWCMAHISNQCTPAPSTRASESSSTHHSRHPLQTDQSWHICHPGPETWARRDRVPSWPFLFYKHPARYATLNWKSSKHPLAVMGARAWVQVGWADLKPAPSPACRPLLPLPSPYAFCLCFLLSFSPWLLASRAGSTQNLPFISTN